MSTSPKVDNKMSSATVASKLSHTGSPNASRKAQKELSDKLQEALNKISKFEAEMSDLKLKSESLEIDVQKYKNLYLSSIREADKLRNEKAPPRKVPKAASVGNINNAGMSVEAGMELDEDLPMHPSTSNQYSGSNQNILQNSVSPQNSSRIASNLPKVKVNNNANVSNNSNGKKVIQVADSSLFAIRKQLVAAKIADFSMKQVTKSGPIKITLNNPAETNAAKSALVNSGTNFHEFLNSAEKRRCFIIRGLVGATYDDLDYIKNDLILAGLPESIQVILHETGYTKANANKPINKPVKVIVPPNMDVNLLNSIKFLNHIVVRFEEFKSTSLIQCKNCQRFGHSARGCQHKHRCVKCSADHYRDQCPRTRDPSVKLVCCNCGGEHTANNINVCQYYLKNYAPKATPVAAKAVPLMSPRNVTNANNAKIPARVVNAQVSYARVSKMGTQRPAMKPSTSTSTSTFTVRRNSTGGAISSNVKQTIQQQQHQQQQIPASNLNSNSINNNNVSNNNNNFNNFTDNLYQKSIEARFGKMEAQLECLTNKFDQLITIIGHLNICNN